MGNSEKEIQELRRLLRDLVALATTPAVWVGRDRVNIAEGVADVLLHTLRADAVYVCLQSPTEFEALRSPQYPGFSDEVKRVWRQAATAGLYVHTIATPKWPRSLSVAIQPIGVSADEGFIAVGCAASAFPNEAESLLLSVAANQTAVALQSARLRIEADLERQRLRDVLAQAPAAIGIMAGPEHRWVYVNENYVRVTGRNTTSDFVGRTLRESLPEIETQPFIQILDEVYRTGQPYVGREMKAQLNRAHTGQPEEAYFDFVYQPVRNAERVVDGILVHAVEVTDKITARAAIQQSEERFRAIVETTPECVKVVAADGTLLHMNSAGLSMIGSNCAEAVIGKNIYDVIAPEDRERFRELNERVCRGERTSLEFDIIGLQGVRRHMETHAAPLRESSGAVVQLAVTRDITEKKRAQEEQRRREEEFRTLADAVPQLVWMANPDGWIFWYNSRWYEYTGTTPEQMEGWGWQAVHDPAVLPRVLESWRRSINTGEPFEMTFPLRGADGSFLPFLTRVIPVRDSSGAITRWFGTNTDVSTEVEVQEKLHNALIASQRLAAIVESSDDAIVSKDLNGIVTSWNPQAERLFGYKEEEMIGRSILTIVPPELHRDEDMILGKIRSGQKIDHFETLRVAKWGERIEVSLSISPVRDEHGNIVGAANITRDIRESKKIERTLRTTEKLAAAGRLAATVAHEINNPLEAVTNLVYLAKRDLPPGADLVASHLSSAKRELDRVAHIARQTLGFYRDTSSPIRFNIAQTVDDLLRLYERRFETRSIQIVKKHDTNAEIVGLAGEIRQALSNLLSNSMDAMPDGGTLSVRVRKTCEWSNAHLLGVRITVADSGSGITAEHRKSIFQPFFTTKSDVGTGLGLWITRGIVEKHGGTIRLKSKSNGKDRGTTFSIFLPFNGTRIVPSPKAVRGEILAGASVQ